jgi:nucleoside recognition membrane protein YjiH
MNKTLTKILPLVAGLIGFIGFFFFVRILIEGDDAIKTDVGLQNGILSPFISFSIFLLIAVAILAVVFSMLNLFKHPDVLKRTMLGVGILAVLLVIAYSFASGEAVTDQMGKILEDGEAGSVSKWISTLINYSFILGAIGLVFFLVDFVKGLVK